MQYSDYDAFQAIFSNWIALLPKVLIISLHVTMLYFIFACLKFPVLRKSVVQLFKSVMHKVLRILRKVKIMARTISKSIASATIYVLDATKPFDTDENGMPVANRSLQCDGAPSMNKARILAEKAFGTKNLMVLSIDVDETKLKVDPTTFYANSQPCVDGEVYGREFVTQTLKVTTITVFYVDGGIPKTVELVYNGETTPSKLLKFARENTSQTAVVTSSVVNEERRYMTREDYLKLAR